MGGSGQSVSPASLPWEHPVLVLPFCQMGTASVLAKRHSSLDCSSGAKKHPCPGALPLSTQRGRTALDALKEHAATADVSAAPCPRRAFCPWRPTRHCSLTRPHSLSAEINRLAAEGAWGKKRSSRGAWRHLWRTPRQRGTAGMLSSGSGLYKLPASTVVAARGLGVSLHIQGPFNYHNATPWLSMFYVNAPHLPFQLLFSSSLLASPDWVVSGGGGRP